MDEVERLRQRQADLEAENKRLRSALTKAASDDGVLLTELRASDRRNSQIIDSAIDFAIVATDLDGLVTRWNEGAHRVLGWSETEMLGQPVDRFFTTEDVAAGRPAVEMRSALETGRGNDERWHQRKSGERFWAVGEMTVLRDEHGAAIGFVKLLRDRTEQRHAEERQRADAEFMRSVLASSSDCIKVLDLDANLVFMSEGGQRVMEVSDFNAIQGCPWPDFWQGPGRDQAEAALATARAGGVGRFQGSADTVAGTPRYWDVQVTAILGRDGAPERLLSISRDVTATWRTETALRESEARYRGLFDAIDEGFCVIRFIDGPHGPWSDYVHIEANPAFEHHLGIPNAVGQTLRGIVGSGEAEGWAKIYSDVLRTGQPTRFQRAFGPTGRHLEVAAHRVEPATRREVAVLFTDITARKRAEEALRDLNETLEHRVAEQTADRNALWQMSRDLLLRCGFDGVITAVNPAWTERLGWGASELIGANLFDLVHPDDIAQTIEGARDLSEGRGHARFENRYRHRDGDYHWISWSTRSGDGTINAIGRDVTPEKEQAEALAKVEEALRQSQKMEAVGQLTGGLAHDFNNLLTGISGSLDLLQKRVAQGRINDLDRYLIAAQGASKRAAALTHRLLAFSRRQTLDPKPTDVRKLVHDMADLIRRTVGPEITLETVDMVGLWTALVDPNQLENALLNLCINARDAMPDGGRITIETANRWMDDRAAKERDVPPGQYLSLCVSDTGTGMPADVIARAFDPFFTTKPIGQGTGLGLSMIYGFARQSGGQVRLYSEVGEGTMVCIYLPRHHGDGVDVGLDPVRIEEAPRAVEGETVLVVDDEPTVRMLVADVLGDLGYGALEAEDGASGLKILQSRARVDLLVTDVGLPNGMNGRQVADAARVLRPGLKVLFITGYAENAVVGNGHLDPGMAVMTKPFAMDDLAAKIRTLIEG